MMTALSPPLSRHHTPNRMVLQLHWSGWQLLHLLRILLLLSASITRGGWALSTTIQVCQNKDCSRRFRGKSTLVQTLQDLVIVDVRQAQALCANKDDNPKAETLKPAGGIAPVEIQTTGCLAQCNLGPNVCLCLDDERETAVSNGIETPLHAVAWLSSASAASVNNPNNKLINAVLLIEKAQAASVYDEQRMLLTTVIHALDADDRLRTSSARVHAQTVRAHASMDAQNFSQALEDVHALFELLQLQAGPQIQPPQPPDSRGMMEPTKQQASITTTTTTTIPPLAAVMMGSLYRIAAAAHEGLLQYDQAAQSWQCVAVYDSSFATKSRKEIARLLQLQQTTTTST